MIPGSKPPAIFKRCVIQKVFWFGITLSLLPCACSSSAQPPPLSTMLLPPATPTFSLPIPPTQIAPTPQATLSFPSCSPLSIPYSPTQTLPFLKPSGSSANQEGATSLRALAQKQGIHIGTAVSSRFLNSPEYVGLLTREFNLMTPEVDMKWEVLHPEPGRYDFSQGDTIVAFAEAYHMAVHGHVLVWDLQLPSWVTEGQYSRQEWMNILCSHIKTVVGHYRGRVYAWDVVNEALDEKGRLRETIWMRQIGPEYFAMAFQWAHEADPGAILVYNDFMAEGLNQKSQAIYSLAQGLLRLGIPLHAVGLQMHVWPGGPPTPQALLSNMQRLSALGLHVYITEMDVRLQYSRKNATEKLADQAEVYRQAFTACLSAPGCKAFSTWGLTDHYSWIPDYTGNPDAPLLFDTQGNPKPAYWAIVEVLQDW